MSVRYMVSNCSSAGAVCENDIHYRNETAASGLSDVVYYFDYVLGTLLIILTIIGITSNSLAIILLTKVKELQTRTSYLLRSLAISDLIMATIGGSMFSINAFHHTWIFRSEGCVFYAMMMYWCGVTSIVHLCAISIERCMTMNSPISAVASKKIPFYIHAMVVFSWVYGLIWAILPLAGIHKYVIEGRLSCSLDWNSGHLHAFIYNVVIFLSTFVLPLAVILCTNGQILYLVRRNFNPKSDSKRQSKQQKREWQMAKIVMEASGFYMLAWTPYGIVSMWSAFGDEKRIPNLAFTFLAFFAKLSFIFNPCVYCFNNPRHRKALSKMVFGKEISKRKHPARGEPAPVPESTQDNLNETEMMSDSDDLLAAHQSQSSDQLVVVVKRVEGGVEMDEHAV